MKQLDDDWRIWRWTVAVGLAALVLVMSYRVAGEALDVCKHFVDIYERTHAPTRQETVTDWPVGESRQMVRTEREETEKIDQWLGRHDEGVIGSSEAARRRAIAEQSKVGGK